MSNQETNGKEIQFQVIGPADIEEIYAFAEARLQVAIADESERTFASWSAKWRRESLEHYLKLGWSFIARLDGKAVGFFLAQPLMFFRGQTQTVWVEYVDAVDHRTRQALIDVAVRVGREKHMQRVLFADSSESELQVWSGKPMNEILLEVKTTKG